jgi:hypothetical protein
MGRVWEIVVCFVVRCLLLFVDETAFFAFVVEALKLKLSPRTSSRIFYS